MTNSVETLTAAVHSDLRGKHSKFFGKTPETIRVDGFTVQEVFMTTNRANVLRGLHLQVDPEQPKIITCITGSAVVNVVCLDPSSDQFGQVLKTLVGGSGDASSTMISVPPLHGLGYRALEDDTRILYLAGADFNAAGDIGVDPFDPDLALDWTTDAEDVFTKEAAVLSPRDQELPSFQDFLVGRDA